ncbi:hypothetical protein PC123_g9384 [Phytophthora cactorum]|nr:hypothetical protein PC123_g9384 [Phytophthora cactorum]
MVKSREACIAAVLDHRAQALLQKVLDDMSSIRHHVLDEYEAEYCVRYENQQQRTSPPPLNHQEAEEVALGAVLHEIIGDNLAWTNPLLSMANHLCRSLIVGLFTDTAPCPPIQAAKGVVLG